ncbi:hypothetical protein ANOM_009525 [Aspergillus nomiae NRRL 13137]|uniref:Zn(2)-C6 fungal-type domain-containing protein n=1 Tax=Aspergillus nomiae NRRL (strain ATCC 15546 / NRRL 13137 / CBS 260.88 / M93) TaxID=1509407 RepID=A0A0L1ISY2_ASPN3|nr:uncharacterized protein ANOM_009525 [Aspergillus nomiae NRRL 13137]KNG82480.1 hypothetical protein ANOM_009525 [Aspergillus nomiae NRRL 13137]
MVNTGLPSKDCHTCRRRRVKCDLGRPGCLRCKKIGHDCPGYRDLSRLGFNFRILTPESYLCHKDPNHDPQVTKGSEQEQDQHFRFAGTIQPQLALTYTPTDQWEDHAKPLVISQFTILTLQGARVYGSFDFLPHLFERTDAKSTLHKVCNAVASACFDNRSRSDSMGFSHKKLYVKALQSLSSDVSHVEKQKQDQTLVAVWLLCLYEIAYPIIQIQAIQAGRPPPPEAIAWLHSMQTSPVAREMLFLPAFLYSDLACRIYSTIRDLIDQGSCEKMLKSIDDVIVACRNLESSIDAVITQGPGPQSQPGPSDDLATGQTQRWLMNQHAANYLNAFLFRVYEGSVELLSQTLEAHVSPKKHAELLCQRESSIKRLLHLADRIIVSLPLLMPAKVARTDQRGPSVPTWGHALKLLWPLGLIACSAHVHDSQRAAAKLGLLRIGYEVGIMRAVRTYA